MNWSAIAAAVLGIAVMLGAFGAHALKGRLDAYSLSVYEKAVFYHFVHGMGLLIVSVLPQIRLISKTAGARICALFVAGILLFSGSLYALAISGERSLGAVTPLGGVAFIAAWLLLAYSLATDKQS